MGGVQHAYLGFRLFGAVNKLDNTCLKDLCVTKTPLGLMPFLSVSTTGEQQLANDQLLGMMAFLSVSTTGEQQLANDQLLGMMPSLSVSTTGEQQLANDQLLGTMPSLSVSTTGEQQLANDQLLGHDAIFERFNNGRTIGCE